MWKAAIIVWIISLGIFPIVIAEKKKLTCPPPPEIPDSVLPDFEVTEHPVGTSFTYSCLFGYVSRNSFNHISTCENHAGKAEWSIPEISCIPRSCGDPGYINNGRRIGNLFTFPNKISFECHEGYKIHGLNERYCQASGEWSGRLPTCELVYCFKPPDPENGRVTYSSLKYGTELNYQCNTGYMVEIHDPRYCTEDGTWSNVEPKCIEVRCNEPIKPDYGRYQLTGDPKVGSTVIYFCDEDKRMVGERLSKCLKTGQWTYDPPKCLSYCTVPEIQNGEMKRISVERIDYNRKKEHIQKIYTGEQINHDEKMTLQCTGDFRPFDGETVFEENKVEVTCNNGTWSRIPQCRKTSCEGEPPKIQRGKAKVIDRHHGYGIWYICDNPFDKKIAGNVTCYFGTWIGKPPQCLPEKCNTDEIEYPGLVKPSRKTFRSLESFDIECEYGFTPTTKNITCNAGMWVISQNPCREEQCNTDKIEYPGFVKPSRNIFSSLESFAVKCDDGFTSTIRSIKCNRGRWDITQNPCREEQCNTDQIEYPGFVKPSRNIFRSLESFEVKCEYGFASTIRSIKCNGGRWDITQNPCREEQCNTDRIEYPGIVKPSRKIFRSLESFEVKCQHGFTPTTKSIKCIGVMWDITENPCLKDSCYTKDLNYEGLKKPRKEFFTNSENFDVSCEVGFIKSTQQAKITCAWGQWYATENPCRKNRCYTEDLNYAGLEKPTKEFLTNSENFEVSCGIGFMKSTQQTKITCIYGQWNVYGDPCRRDDSGEEIAPMRHSDPVTPKNAARENSSESSIHPTSDLKNTRECYCTYNRADHLINATIGSKIVDHGGKVKQGDTVIFHCMTTRYLTWEYGLVIQGSTNMTCTTCQIWNTRDSPKCPATQAGQPFIVLDDSFEMKPGGVVEVEAGKSFELWCGSKNNYPAWYFNGKIVTNIARSAKGENISILYSYTFISNAEEEDSGMYECVTTIKSRNRDLRSVLKLQVKKHFCHTRELNYSGLIKPSEEPFRHLQNFNIYCEKGFEKSTAESVISCLNGQWNITESPCTKEYFCHTRELNYSGLIKPIEGFVRHSQYFPIYCEKGFGKSTAENVISCLNGQWNITESPCTKEINETRTIPPVLLEKAGTVPTDVHLTSTQPSVGELELTNSSSSNLEDTNDCYCTYEREGFITVRAKDRTLRHGDKVKKGETVSFKCGDYKFLSWQNGLRVYGTANVTCATCDRWQNTRNPACSEFQYGPPFIVFAHPLKLLAKGTAIVDVGMTFQLLCGSTYNYPTWTAPYPATITEEKFIRGGNTGASVFYSSVHVTAHNNQVNGKYECSVRNVWKTTLEIEVRKPGCSIAKLSEILPTKVIPEMKAVTGEYVSNGSRIKLKCDEELVFIGNRTVKCKNDGEWRLESYQCVPGCLLNQNKSSSLVVNPRKDTYRLGDHIVLSCPDDEELTSDAKRLMCLGKKWSHPLPDCKKKKVD